ncbi:Putative periplasmic protein [Campylobacter concisus UNSWCS]|uniref:Putative periplasmic protein n=2 Tax=Campylobacter concisus TaxID=199 RepID=U2FFK1_9BACT|nr:Putative periplasmic protein [Campylobacter concisus UNSWCS]
MGRRTLLSVVVLLFVMLGLVGVYLVKFASVNFSQTTEKNITSEQNITKNTAGSENWINELATIKKKDYVLPVNEIFIEYNRPKIEKPKITAYELLIDKNDIYSMFCLMQTLRNSEVDFTVVKDGAKSQIFLNTQDSRLLQNIILQLRVYDIHSSVREVKL